MSAKAKYEKIDQSKLSENVRKLLEQMKEKTNNFEDEEAVKTAKVEEALDKLIEKFPEIVKTPSKTRTVSQKKAPEKKSKKSDSTTGGTKRETVMTVAQRIRKKDESWKDALSRAKSEMGKENQKKASAVKNEIEKLKELLKNDSVLKDFGKSDLERDSVRKALPKGKRVTKNKGKTTNQYGTFKNKVGKVYYENRENRSDRYSPSFPKDKPFLENGGELMALTGDMQQLGIANADFIVMEKGGEIDLFEDYENMPEELSLIVEKYNQLYEDGEMDYMQTKEFLQEVEEIGYTFNFGLDNEPFALRKKSVKLTELSGYEDVLDDSSDYLENGGFIAFYNNKKVNIEADSLYEAKQKAIEELKVPKSKQGLLAVVSNKSMQNEDFRFMAKGGTLDAHGLQEGDVIVRNILDFQEVKTKNGDIVYVDLEDGYRGKQPPLPFAKGGRLKSALMRDRKYFNKKESWERSYNKSRDRKGYKEDGGLIENSTQSFVNYYQGQPSFAEGGQVEMKL
jgi:hypothetical protein